MVTKFEQSKYADVECEGCLAGEDCYGWTTDTLMCPSRREAERLIDEYEQAVREYEDEHPGSVAR